MAQKIRFAYAILILAFALTYSVSAQSKVGTTEKEVVIVLPTNIKISPGRSYKAILQISGKSVAAQIKVPSVQSPQQPSEPKINDKSKEVDQPHKQSGFSTSPEKESLPPPTSTPILRYALVAAITLLLIAAGAWIYWKMIRPQKQLRPYKEALMLLREQRYEDALPLLTQVESKLPDNIRREARFYIAFASFQLQDNQEAEHILVALHREDQKDPHAAYLLSYIRVKSQRYDEAESVLERMESNGQLNLCQAKKLLGIVKFQRALIALKEGRVDAAGELFEKVHDLGDFASQIPSDLRNRNIVLGTKALFEKNLVEANQQFESLLNAVAKLPQELQSTLTATAKLGLALAKWIEDTPDGEQAIENLLVEAAQLLDSQGDLEMTWPLDASEKDVIEKLKALDASADLAAEKQEINLLLRDIHFLRGMAWLRAWRKMDSEKAHSSIETQYESSLKRFVCARVRDEEFSDVYLVVGLLMYYLHKSGPERSRGIDLLQQAQKRGMRDPNAMEIINNRERIERANADAVDKYLQILDKFLTDDTVRKEIRLALMERLAKYKRIKSWDKRPDLAKARTVEPTLAEMRNRSEILSSHINQIISLQGKSEEVAKVKSLSKAIEQDSEQLYERAKALEKKESELLVETGNQLFKD